MNLSETVAELVRAAFPGLWVRTHEPDEAVAELAALCRTEGWTLAAWDLERGLARLAAPAGADGDAGPAPAVAAAAADPLATVRALPGLAAPGETAVLVLRHFHRLLGGPDVVQAVETQLARGKADRHVVVVMAPVVEIPPELERQFVVVEHELPGRDQLEAVFRGVATEPGELPRGDDLAAVLDAAAGLTRTEAEGAAALSLVRHGRVLPAALWELKSQALAKSALLGLSRGGGTFADLGGLDALKQFCGRALRPGRPAGVRPRGVLLLGVPGTGKSAFCRALGAETGRPTLVLDVGALMGSLVGQTEANVRRALALADAMAPCVLMVDEVEKALAGAAGGGRSDSGVSARLFGHLLSWLNDHESDVFVVCTANDVTALPPEFSRAERFDACFFLDLPSAREKAAIWRLHLDRYGLDPEQRRPPDRDWTGAEIRACCRLAALLDVPPSEAARQIVPVAATARESVERLRDWASGRYLSADRPGLYVRHAAGGGPDAEAGRGGRRVNRGGPSAN